MKLENQVCTLEQAKKLNDLGIIQGLSAFYYNRNTQRIEYNRGSDSDKRIISFFNARYCISVFTVAELGLMLPDGFCGDNVFTQWIDERFGEPGRQFTTSILTVDMQVGWRTEASCRADLLIYLIESNITSREEVNKRLNE